MPQRLSCQIHRLLLMVSHAVRAHIRHVSLGANTLPRSRHLVIVVTLGVDLMRAIGLRSRSPVSQVSVGMVIFSGTFGPNLRPQPDNLLVGRFTSCQLFPTIACRLKVGVFINQTPTGVHQRDETIPSPGRHEVLMQYSDVSRLLTIEKCVALSVAHGMTP